MIANKIFEGDLAEILQEELVKRGITVKQLSLQTGIPVSTLYKITQGGSDPRFSTVKKIVSVFQPPRHSFVAVIAARFLLDTMEPRVISVGSKTYTIKGYPAHSLEECIVAAARAEKDGAVGIICAPILASIVEKIVDIPVVMLRPDLSVIDDAIANITRRLK